MKQGDFTNLAKQYAHRSGYALPVLSALSAHVGVNDTTRVADVGAGTGKLTENLISLGLSGYAVEPNDAMRAEGVQIVGDQAFTWRAGSAEATGLPDSCVDWVFMGSSFHWADPALALNEFHRILRPGGAFTAIWNPRDIERSDWHQQIENEINKLVPDLKRVSSGGRAYTKDLENTLLGSGQFGELIFVEAPHDEAFTVERYLGAWRSVNDIQAQAGPERFAEIMAMIEQATAGREEVVVPYRSRAWTVRRK